jgi:hypothetical protein
MFCNLLHPSLPFFAPALRGGAARPSAGILPTGENRGMTKNEEYFVGEVYYARLTFEMNQGND